MLLLPGADGFFVALQGAAGGALHAPVHGPQKLPDVPGVIGDTELLLDQVGYAPAGPQRRLVTQPLGALLEQLR